MKTDFRTQMDKILNRFEESVKNKEVSMEERLTQREKMKEEKLDRFDSKFDLIEKSILDSYDRVMGEVNDKDSKTNERVKDLMGRWEQRTLEKEKEGEERVLTVQNILSEEMRGLGAKIAALETSLLGEIELAARKADDETANIRTTIADNHSSHELSFRDQLLNLQNNLYESIQAADRKSQDLSSSTS